MPSLVFHTTNIDYVPDDLAKMIRVLQEKGFLGDKWQAPDTVSGERYLIGDSFLSLVTFMGCAPAIELEPLEEKPESTAFCHIEINEPRQQPEFICGSEHLISRCPHCRQRHANWKITPDSMSYACDKCKVESHLSEYDWKNTAGCGRFFIRLHGIYPQEAIPTPHLLKIFESISHCPWQYFYIHDV